MNKFLVIVATFVTVLFPYSGHAQDGDIECASLGYASALINCSLSITMRPIFSKVEGVKEWDIVQELSKIKCPYTYTAKEDGDLDVEFWWSNVSGEDKDEMVRQVSELLSTAKKHCMDTYSYTVHDVGMVGIGPYKPEKKSVELPIDF